MSIKLLALNTLYLFNILCSYNRFLTEVQLSLVYLDALLGRLKQMDIGKKPVMPLVTLFKILECLAISIFENQILIAWMPAFNPKKKAWLHEQWDSNSGLPELLWISLSHKPPTLISLSSATCEQDFKRFLGSASAAGAANAASAADAANAATTTSSWKLISFAKFSTSNWRQFSRSLGCKKMSGAVSQMGVAPRCLFERCLFER